MGFCSLTTKIARNVSLRPNYRRWCANVENKANRTVSRGDRGFTQLWRANLLGPNQGCQISGISKLDTLTKLRDTNTTAGLGRSEVHLQTKYPGLDQYSIRRSPNIPQSSPVVQPPIPKGETFSQTARNEGKSKALYTHRMETDRVIRQYKLQLCLGGHLWTVQHGNQLWNARRITQFLIMKKLRCRAQADRTSRQSRFPSHQTPKSTKIFSIIIPLLYPTEIQIIPMGNSRMSEERKAFCNVSNCGLAVISAALLLILILMKASRLFMFK
jgi:hypothetical protein